ncbi:hypothetical protein STVA_48140 [Allostella vacuolata]|nr:hypothetical protein STVA_48140 [Stella vacuolata]
MTGEAATLEDKVRFLRRPGSYPFDAREVIARETHMSWLFLVGNRVYKLKKPVRFPYLDFSTLQRREAACRAEWRLNRRLAPDVYLDVVPLSSSQSGLAIGGEGVVTDWLVVMRRLQEEATLEAALRAHRLELADADRIAATLGAFYARARRVPVQPARHVAAWRAALAYNRRVLLDPRFDLPRGCVERIARTQRRFLVERSRLLRARVHGGRIVDAHGDLRPEHIWLCDRVTIIDCLEFDPQLRALDALDEIAFLHLECDRLGARWVGERIRRRLARRLGEEPASGLFVFYRSHRAMLRARLSIAHLLDAQPSMPEKWQRAARAYLHLAAADAARLDRLLRTRAGR